ncbi:MAG: hypothetical protein J5J00_09240 [Deltaproteobacteria bacterium]|nr:hypothetical protein [Deltaproteobacteria bacterium]
MKQKLIISVPLLVIAGLAYLIFSRDSFPGINGKHAPIAEECRKGDVRRCSMLASFLQDEGDISNARWLFQKACDGNDAYGCYSLGSILRKEGDDVAADRLYKKSCSLDPKDGGVEACLETGHALK